MNNFWGKNHADDESRVKGTKTVAIFYALFQDWNKADLSSTH